ncbi:MAG: signal peptide peptidase SppA [Sphingomonadales bacterium]|nr:signal peptide peptidase SppA [Sphingomonadales bacterium]
MKNVLAAVWRVIKIVQSVVSTLLFFLILFFIVLILFSIPSGERPEVPKRAALMINPQGAIVEQLTQIDPLDDIFAVQDRAPETLLRDMLFAIRQAKDDERVEALVLTLDDMGPTGLSKLYDISEALTEFKESGKPVIAYGDYFAQGQYFLAAQADEVYLHPLGSVVLTGFGIYPTYMAAGLEKIKATVNVFKVGTYKSAIEPLIRDDMSPEAKEANALLLADLWQPFAAKIEADRGLEAGTIQAGYATLSDDLRAAGGDFAQLAVDQGLVDALKNRDEVRARLVEMVGADSSGNSFNRVAMADYVAATQPEAPGKGDKVAVVVARGTILDGDQPAGNAGGDTVARLIRQAHEKDAVKAIVLRVDSPGGSAFASEIIRREVEVAKSKAKPVVVSMGSLAASGGYWISATADEIWAAPATITGSIGIFGFFPTFDRSLDAIGVHSDGVGTTPLAGAFDVMRPMDDFTRDLIQQSIEDGYRKFLGRVAEGRDMTLEQVDAIGQGRVWSGRRALEFGLVDKLGDIDEAVASAAALAEVEDYATVYVEDEPSFEEKLIRMFFSTVGGGFNGAGSESLAQAFFRDVSADLRGLLGLNDPNNVYAVCLACEVR